MAIEAEIAGLLDGVHVDDARVIEGRDGPGLALEPKTPCRRAQLGGQHLQGDPATEPRILGLEDRAHPFPSNEAHDTVETNLLTRFEIGRLLVLGSGPRRAGRSAGSRRPWVAEERELAVSPEPVASELRHLA